MNDIVSKPEQIAGVT